MKWESCRLILNMNVGCLLSKTRIESRYYGGGMYDFVLSITVSCKQLGGEMMSGFQNPKVSLCRPSEGIIIIWYLLWSITGPALQAQLTGETIMFYSETIGHWNSILVFSKFRKCSGWCEAPTKIMIRGHSTTTWTKKLCASRHRSKTWLFLKHFQRFVHPYYYSILAQNIFKKWLFKAFSKKNHAKNFREIIVQNNSHKKVSDSKTKSVLPARQTRQDQQHIIVSSSHIRIWYG